MRQLTLLPTVTNDGGGLIRLKRDGVMKRRYIEPRVFYSTTVGFITFVLRAIFFFFFISLLLEPQSGWIITMAFFFFFLAVVPVMVFFFFKECVLVTFDKWTNDLLQYDLFLFWERPCRFVKKRISRFYEISWPKYSLTRNPW